MIPSNATERFQRSEILAISLIAISLLASIVWIPRAAAVSSMPWKAELVGAIAFAILLLLFLKVRVPRHRYERYVVITLLSFVIWSALSTTWARSWGWSIHHTLTWGIYIAVFVAAIRMLRTGRGHRTILTAFGAVSLVLVVMAISDILSIENFWVNQGITRIRYGKFAEMTATAAPLLAAWMLYLRGRRLAFAAASWLGAWGVVMLSLSKGAFLAGIAAHLVFFAGSLFWSSGQFRRKTFGLAAIWLLVTIGAQVGFSTLTTIPSTTDYISGAADKTRFTSVFRTFAWRVAFQMWKGHALLGVGAGNFGLAFNQARADLAAARPDDRGIEMAEDHMVERADNEPLQTGGELGIVGVAILAVLFGASTVLAIRWMRRRKWTAPPIFWGSVAGMAAFFASSMVSSFSFRAIQNGIAFFLVFAVAVREVSKNGKAEMAGSIRWPLVGKTAILFCAAMVIFSGIKGISEYQLYLAEYKQDFGQASELYRSSLLLDRDNANAYYFFAERTAKQNNDHVVAADLLREGIDRGIGVTLTYSKLATYYQLAGDQAAAKRTLDEAVSVFPNSVFIRVRYAHLLDSLGERDSAAAHLRVAASIDARQATGWEAIIRDGSVAAFYQAKKNPSIAGPAELLPQNAVLDYVDKDQIPAQ